MAIQRTTPGSYEAPVEGIVDYGAFQKGFRSSFIVPQPEEEEEKPKPISYDKQNATYVNTEDKPTAGLQLNTIFANALGSSISTFTKKVNEDLNNLAIGGEDNQQAINNRILDYKDYKNSIIDFNGFSKTTLGAEGTMHYLTKTIPFARNPKTGQTISIIEFYSEENQREGGKHNINTIRGENDRRITTLDSNGYEVVLNDINKDNATNFFFMQPDLNTSLKEFEQTPEGKPKNITSADRSTTTTQSTYDLASGDRQQTGTTATGKIRDDVYTEINTSASRYGESLSKDKDIKPTLYADILFGQDNEENYNNQVSGGYIDAFKDGKFVASDDTEWTFEQFKNEFFKKDGSIPSFVKDELVKQYGSDYYKINSGSGHHVDGGNGHAVAVDDVVSETTSTKDKASDGGLSFNFGGVGVDENLYNAISETDKYGRSDDVAGTLFFTKNLPTGDNQSPTFDQEMLISVNPSASGNKTKQVIFDLNKGEGKPKFIVYDFGYSMAQDASKVYLNREGEVVEKGSKGAIEVIPKTAQEYVQSRFSTKADQKKYSKTINDVYDTRKKNYAQKQQAIRDWMANNPGRTQQEAEAAYAISQN